MTKVAKTKVAVIGAGRMGGRHANNLLKGRVSGAKLCAVCDISDDALSKYQGRVDTFKDYKKMIADIKPDAVVIATPHYAHGEIAKYAIEKGVHTLVEKPLTVTTLEAKEVIALSKSHPSVIAQVMLNQRTNPLYIRAKKIIERGEIGEIRRVNYIITNWYRSQAYYNLGGWRASLNGEGGGMLINQCVHQLDLIQWITGMPTSVNAILKTRGRDISTENEATITFEYNNGSFCSFTASTCELHGTNRLEIAGDRGRIVVDRYKMTVTTFQKSEQEVNSTTKFGYGSVTIKHTKKYSAVPTMIRELLYGQQINILRNFVGAIRGEQLSLTPLQEGLNCVEMINGAYMSNWEESKINLPIDDEKYEKMLAYKRDIENKNHNERGLKND